MYRPIKIQPVATNELAKRCTICVPTIVYFERHVSNFLVSIMFLSSISICLQSWELFVLCQMANHAHTWDVKIDQFEIAYKCRESMNQHLPENAALFFYDEVVQMVYMYIYAASQLLARFSLSLCFNLQPLNSAVISLFESQTLAVRYWHHLFFPFEVKCTQEGGVSLNSTINAIKLFCILDLHSFTVICQH